MSPLWSDMALARAALAKLEETDSATSFTRSPARPSTGATAAGARVRRLLRPQLSSFVL
jgi:hypothetical protein